MDQTLFEQEKKYLSAGSDKSGKSLRVLITTQAVDKDDPVLGFFVRWLVEIATRSEFVHVICLREGLHDLPHNVRVHSLGKSSGERGGVFSRVRYSLRFLHYLYSLRSQYDAVFVHMNAEYVVLGGLWWRAWGKRIVLWRNHKAAGVLTWIAAHLAHVVCFTSKAAYVARFKNAVQMPIGIDTDLFVPPSRKPKSASVLFLGRLDEVKRPHIFLEALEQLHERGVFFSATIVGDPTDAHSAYAREVRNRASRLLGDGVLTMRPALPHAGAAKLYHEHAIYVNLTPSGSFDKTIGEAAASGCMLVVANAALEGVLPERCIVDPHSAASVAAGLEAALALSEEERTALSEHVRTYVRENHSLDVLAGTLLPTLFPTRS